MEVWWERGGTCEREGLGAAAVLFALAHECKWGDIWCGRKVNCTSRCDREGEKIASLFV